MDRADFEHGRIIRCHRSYQWSTQSGFGSKSYEPVILQQRRGFTLVTLLVVGLSCKAARMLNGGTLLFKKSLLCVVRVTQQSSSFGFERSESCSQTVSVYLPRSMIDLYALHRYVQQEPFHLVSCEAKAVHKQFHHAYPDRYFCNIPRLAQEGHFTLEILIFDHIIRTKLAKKDSASVAFFRGC